MLEYLGLQSYLQFKRLRDQVEAHIKTGKIINHSNEKVSAFRRGDPAMTRSVSTDSVTKKIRDASSEHSKEVGSQQDGSSQGDAENDIIVGWEGIDDPLNPRHWSLSWRCTIFAILWINVFAVDWAGACDSKVSTTIEKVFGVGPILESLSPSLYTFGLAFGSLFAGPISETTGRLPVYVVSRIFHVVWLIGAALAPNFTSQAVFRTLAGISGSILLAIHAASTADLFGPIHRTIAWPVIALASFWGTSLSPVVGAWIDQTGIWWRWTEWIAVILSGSTLFLTIFCLPETFTPILLSWRAKHLRDLTGSQRFQSELDLQKSFPKRLKIAFTRALHMITREPIVLLLGGWLVLEYIVVFGFLQGFRYIFEDTYSLSSGLAGTVFVAIGTGCTLWSIAVPLYYRLYKKKVVALHTEVTGEVNNDILQASNIPGTDLPQPEYRLWQALIAGPALPISLFWLGWTNYKSISPWSDVMALVLLGFSWAGIYVTVYQYLLDTYGIYAGSALAIVTCWRYLASGASNLYSGPMYEGIGVHWSATWLAILAVLQAPLPLIFYKYGPQIRMRSAFAGKYARPENPRDRVGSMLAYTGTARERRSASRPRPSENKERSNERPSTAPE